MYARSLMLWLHERLAGVEEFRATEERFERLRGNRLLPVGRENAGVRLSDEQIASAVLAFSHPAAGWAGHASLVFGDLRPVGGITASFEGASNLLEALALLVGNQKNSLGIQRVTLSIERNFHEDEYSAQIRYIRDGQKRVVSFVSKLACSLFAVDAEKSYDPDLLHKMSAVQRSFGADFFRDLSQSVSIARQLDRPFKTDWREYQLEEEFAEFWKNLGARPSSRFLNLRVEALVTWPKEPTRIKFGGHHMVLFPKTLKNSSSVSIDLANERISHDDARSLINRMLSVMSWCDDQPASLHDGWSGNPVPVPVPRQDLGQMTAYEWRFFRTPPEESQLKRCLAYYRDGLNADLVGLSSHAVLSFYRGDCQKSCVRGRVDHHALTNLSSNMMANCVFASHHSRGGIFHSPATWRKTR